MSILEHPMAHNLAKCLVCGTVVLLLFYAPPLHAQEDTEDEQTVVETISIDGEAFTFQKFFVDMMSFSYEMSGPQQIQERPLRYLREIQIAHEKFPDGAVFKSSFTNVVITVTSVDINNARARPGNLFLEANLFLGKKPGVVFEKLEALERDGAYATLEGVVDSVYVKVRGYLYFTATLDDSERMRLIQTQTLISSAVRGRALRLYGSLRVPWYFLEQTYLKSSATIKEIQKEGIIWEFEIKKIEVLN